MSSVKSAKNGFDPNSLEQKLQRSVSETHSCLGQRIQRFCICWNLHPRLLHIWRPDPWFPKQVIQDFLWIQSFFFKVPLLLWLRKEFQNLVQPRLWLEPQGAGSFRSSRVVSPHQEPDPTRYKTNQLRFLENPGSQLGIPSPLNLRMDSKSSMTSPNISELPEPQENQLTDEITYNGRSVWTNRGGGDRKKAKQDIS